ncbi:MAG: carboxypeptidase regulatory-like domain-containing protein [Sedimentisphaerales bacterium]
MKKLIPFIILAAIATNVAIAGTITGVVTKDSNGQPISGIWIYTLKYDTGEYCGGDSSNSDGLYFINGLTAGTYKVGVSVSGTQYASEYYNNQIRWKQATPVVVPGAGTVQNINFSLGLGVSISGVVKNSAGIGQANVQVNCWADNGYGTGTRTEPNGFYKCDGLPVGYNYNVVAYPPADSNYMITRITVNVYQPSEYTNKDIVLKNGGLKISGKVTDKTTTLPLNNVLVGLWNDDVEIWAETRTDANGMYLLANLPPGDMGIEIRPEPPYAYTGTEIELAEDINNMDFALPLGATLCGKILDADTARPIADIEIEYDNERYNAYRNAFTGDDGTFCLTQLPPGIAEIKAMPNVNTGYAWNLPWGSNFISLNEGENRSGRAITLKKGALVRGYIKDADGNAFSGIEYSYTGRNSEGWGDADANGFYQIRLPLGTYAVGIDYDDAGFGLLSEVVTVTDVSQSINVSDRIAYDEENGNQISGTVNNPSAYPKTGVFTVMAFEAGTAITPNNWPTFWNVGIVDMEQAGPFIITALPPDVNYDIYLCAYNQSPDVESVAVQDIVLNVAGGTGSINLEYNSEGSTVRGTVNNTDGLPILGAAVLLSDLSNRFRGFSDVNSNGEYVIYNVPVGTYTATAVHSKYVNTSTTVEVAANGTTVDADDIVVPFEGGKEGPDLNGNGVIDLFDIAEFSSQWLDAGTNEANFNHDDTVNFLDWLPLANNWLWKAIWLND